MKYTRNDFLAALNQTIEIDEQISVEENPHLHNTEVKSVPQCHITGALHFDGRNKVSSELHLEGVMTVLDSITGEDLDLDFETDSETVYSFVPVSEDEDEVIAVKKDTIDLNPEIFQAIVYEAPMSITRLSRDEYPSGNGWKLISDQDPKSNEDDEIDPRWAKLKDFQVEDD